MNRFVTPKGFVQISKRFVPNLNAKEFSAQLDSMSHGDFLAKKVNEETGQEVFYFLKKNRFYT